MKLSHLAAALPTARLEGGDADIRALTHDSRRVGPGTLYVALRGRTVDGLRFVPNAITAGAAAVAVEGDAQLAVDVPVLRLAAPRRDLATLAAALHGHPSTRLKLVGVTGTNGKTTVSTLFAAIADAAGWPAGLVGTIEHRVGRERRPAAFTTPEAPDLQALLAEIVAAGAPAAAMEVSSVGLAEHRVDALRFAAAAFLNLTPDHLDYHGDMAAYGAAKRRLFTDLLAEDAVVVVDVDDPFGPTLLADAPGAWRLSIAPDAATEVRWRDLVIDARGVRGTLVTPVAEVGLESPLLGAFNAANVACAAALALAVGAPAEAVAAGLRGAVVRGRLQPVPHAGGPTVLVDYAHSPDALARVLATLRPLTAGALWCVFGCGGDRDRAKRGPMGAAAAAADVVVVTNDNPRGEDPAAIAEAAVAGAVAAGRPRADTPRPGATVVELDRRRAIELAVRAAGPDDTVLIAGKGHETYQEQGGARRPFDDVAIAAAALATGEAAR